MYCYFIKLYDFPFENKILWSLCLVDDSIALAGIASVCFPPGCQTDARVKTVLSTFSIILPFTLTLHNM